MLSAIKLATEAPVVEPLPACGFAALVDQHGDAIYKFCRRLTFSKEDANDLFQETFQKALEQQHKMGGAKSPESFLFSTAIYLWKSWKRKYARRDRLAPSKPFDENLLYTVNMAEDIIVQEENSLVRAIVADLPEKFEIPIIMHYSIGMGLADIADTLGLPGGTVKSRLFKARKLIEKGLVLNGYER